MADIDADNAGDAGDPWRTLTRIPPVMQGMLGLLSPKSGQFGRTRGKQCFWKVLGGRKRGKYGSVLSRQAST